MIRDVDIKGNVLTIDWDQSDYDIFFRAGIQKLADDHFGERKVVVIPVGDIELGPGTKQVEVSDAFADMCVSEGIHQAIRDYIDSVDPADIKEGKIELS